MLSERLQDFLLSLLGKFSGQKISYAFLKDYEYFPEILGGDIDIAILKRYFKDIEAVIFSNIKCYRDLYAIVTERGKEYLQIRIVDSSTTSELHITEGDSRRVDLTNSNGKECQQFVTLDIQRGYLLDGYMLYSFCDFLENIQEYNNIKIFNKPAEFSMLITRIYVKDKYEPRYIKRIRELASYIELKDFIPFRIFDTQHLETILPLFQEEKNITRENLKKIFTKKFKNKIKMTQRRTTFKRFFNRHFKGITHWMIKRCHARFPFFIVLLGPDGSGKSTIGFLLEKKLNALGIQADYFHYSLGRDSFRVKKMPQFKEYSNAKKFLEKFPWIVQEIVKGLWKIYRKVRSEARFIPKFIKYNKKYLCALFKGVRHNRLSIVERFPLNACINKHQCRFVSFLRYFVSFFVYKPNRVYFLHCDPEIICQRKTELTPEEAAGFMEYEKKIISDRGICSKVVDASKSTEEIVNDIVRDLLEFLRHRVRIYFQNK